MAKIKASKVKFKVYTLLTQAVEDGIQAGYYKAHKYSHRPSLESYIEHMTNAIMLNFDEIINFEE